MITESGVEGWLVQAQRDLDAAELLLESGLWDTSAFHSQQAAEKALKALYLHVHGAQPPRTHRVERLAQDLGAP